MPLRLWADRYLFNGLVNQDNLYEDQVDADEIIHYTQGELDEHVETLEAALHALDAAGKSVGEFFAEREGHDGKPYIADKLYTKNYY